VVDNAELDPHLEHLVNLILAGPERLKQLHELMSRNGVKADVSCFWRGRPGTRPPSIPAKVISRLNQLPAEIETDFEVDEA